MGGIPKTQVLMLTFLMHHEERVKSQRWQQTQEDKTSGLMSLTWICTNYLQLLCNHFTEKL